MLTMAHITLWATRLHRDTQTARFSRPNPSARLPCAVIYFVAKSPPCCSGLTGCWSFPRYSVYPSRFCCRCFEGNTPVTCGQGRDPKTMNGARPSIAKEDQSYKHDSVYVKISTHTALFGVCVCVCVCVRVSVHVCVCARARACLLA